MASNIGGRLQDLRCPLCLDTFRKATNLDCGHTFCRGCLESCVKENYYTDRIIKCPVCRKDTKLGRRSVKDLTPNYAVRSLEDGFNNEVQNSSRTCPHHKQVYLDIFCDFCEEFICHKCYGTDHQGHKTHKYEELEVEWTKKRQQLVQKIDRRKIKFEEFENEADQDRIDIHCYLSSLEKEINDVFAKKVTVLKETKEGLLKEVDEIRKDSDKVINDCVDKHRMQLEKISRSLTARDGDLDADTLKTFHLQYNDLNNSFEEGIENEAIIRAKQRAKSSKFTPDDYENTLALGSIEVGVTKKSGEHRESGSIHDSAIIVRNVHLPKSTWGMAAATCDDAVVVGYGDQREGSDCFSSSGERKPYVTNGAVWDIAVQANGRSVVSHSKNTCNVYEETIKKGCSYRLVKNTCRHYDSLKEGGWYMMLSCDQQDNTYAVNYNKEIYIFRGNNPEPQTVVPTGDTKASQICVTKKSGVMITSTCDTTPSTITVLDREGHIGSTLKATYDNEYLFAAVDTQDRVLVARVRDGSDVLGLSRYELNGTELKLETRFRDLKLPHAIHSIEPSQSFWCYMVSLTPNRLAFANHRHLYFIEIPNNWFVFYSLIKKHVSI